ncbi:MAG: tRNA preQ1(34) S-adenosylmethionine ribosyltransferase-isomerase QueA [Coriobacteriia bacterium]|nr:tRNA preQ1(34) S-adenosylmethionine ribosyltransferase-isomerase QueA [Coriobacteriia bacterium]
MLTSDFDYSLPKERIAQSPVVPRDSCKLLVLNRAKQRIEHRVFSDIITYLTPKDLLVVNETRVMPARLIGTRSGGGEAELLLLNRLETLNEREELWEALVRPGKRLKPGALVSFEGMEAEIVNWVISGERGQRVVKLRALSNQNLHEAIHAIGSLPLPPYITNYTGDTELYQTVYAAHESSAAAPTAGLHFTPELLAQIKEQGTRLETVDLTVGLDTFRIVEEEHLEEHQIHSENYTVSQQVIDAIAQTRKQGGRVIAVGTTSVRCLESAWNEANQQLTPRTNEATELFITPGYQFRAVDALITNFHVPRSTLLALVSAFADRESIMRAYNEALENDYRFLSFGDAMLIV